MFESKAATTRQIQNRFFPNAAYQTACGRIHLLTKNGWIRRFALSDDGCPRNAYSISDKAYKKYVFSEGENDRRHQTRSDSLSHDIALVDIRAALEKCVEVKKVFPENVLQSHQRFSKAPIFCDCVELRSDAVVELLVQNRHSCFVPLEYEASLKSVERCEKKILNYYTRFDGEDVFFICKDKNVLRRMAEVELDLGNAFRGKMHFALLENVLSHDGKIRFQSAKGEVFSIN